MQKWEYLTVQLLTKEKKGMLKVPNWDAENFSEQLNTYGQQGWELVSFFCPLNLGAGSGGTTGVFATFKRPL